MMKKMLIPMLLIVLFLLVPVKNAFADEDVVESPKPYDYTKGLLDDAYILSSLDTNMDPQLYNNKLNDYRKNMRVYLNFGVPIDVEAIFLDADVRYSQVRVTFFDGDSHIINLKSSDLGYVDFDLKNVTRIDFIPALNYVTLSEIDIFGSYKKKQYEAVSNINVVDISHNKVKLSFDVPDGAKKTSVWLDNEHYKNTTDNSITIDNLKPGSKYKIGFISDYGDGALSKMEYIEIMTEPEPEAELDKEVENIRANALYNRVDLTWSLPSNGDFQHVNIYRDEVRNRNFFDGLFGVSTVAAATKIFETNGTYFNDLTVAPEKKYEYLLTTTSAGNVESDGVSVVVTTPKVPLPEIGGGGSVVDPDTGDYTFYWSEPKTGTVKVMVGGKLHATVAASDGRIVIRAADMRYTLFGAPDVRLIPVAEDGTEGLPSKPPEGGGVGGIELPFGIGDVLEGAFSFVKMIGPFLLLLILLTWVPVIVSVIKKSIKAEKGRINANR